MIQDAHSVPDAQRNIRSLIDHFQQKYGTSLVALEGASGQMDPRMLRNFPDRERLTKVLEDYFEKGELTGPTAAAILNKSEGDFAGIEDWQLYEKGYGFFLQALEQQDELTEKIKSLETKIQKQKGSVYSEALLELDGVLATADEDSSKLPDALKLLAQYQRPFKGSKLAAVLAEIKKTEADRVPEERELNQIAERLLRFFEKRQSSAETAELQRHFTEKFQAFRTGGLSSEAFATVLLELAGELRVSVNVSKQLTKLAVNHRALNGMKGAVFFAEFSAYVRQVKEGLFRNQDERRLDRRTHQLGLLKKLVKLELNFEEWGEISKKRILDDGSWILDEKQHPKSKIQYPSSIFAPNFAFYQNAEERDNVFFSNLLHAMTSKHQKTALLVTGGFHTQGLEKQFKKAGISYLVVVPEIQSIPRDNRYREHMRGNVSWSPYYQAESGRVSPYKAFVRAVRDELLAVKNEALKMKNEGDASASLNVAKRHRNSSFLYFNFSLLKHWRDAVVRNLALQGRLATAGDYTVFLDELQGEDPSRKVIDQNLERLRNVISGLKQLEAEGRFTKNNILSILSPATMLSGHLNVQFPGLRMNITGSSSSDRHATSTLTLSSRVPKTPRLRSGSRAEMRSGPDRTGWVAVEPVEPSWSDHYRVTGNGVIYNPKTKKVEGLNAEFLRHFKVLRLADVTVGAENLQPEDPVTLSVPAPSRTGETFSVAVTVNGRPNPELEQRIGTIFIGPGGAGQAIVRAKDDPPLPEGKYVITVNDDSWQTVGKATFEVQEIPEPRITWFGEPDITFTMRLRPGEKPDPQGTRWGSNSLPHGAVLKDARILKNGIPWTGTIRVKMNCLFCTPSRGGKFNIWDRLGQNYVDLQVKDGRILPPEDCEPTPDNLDYAALAQRNNRPLLGAFVDADGKRYAELNTTYHTGSFELEITPLDDDWGGETLRWRIPGSHSAEREVVTATKGLGPHSYHFASVPYEGFTPVDGRNVHVQRATSTVPSDDPVWIEDREEGVADGLRRTVPGIIADEKGFIYLSVKKAVKGVKIFGVLHERDGSFKGYAPLEVKEEYEAGEKIAVKIEGPYSGFVIAGFETETGRFFEGEGIGWRAASVSARIEAATRTMPGAKIPLTVSTLDENGNPLAGASVFLVVAATEVTQTNPAFQMTSQLGHASRDTAKAAITGDGGDGEPFLVRSVVTRGTRSSSAADSMMRTFSAPVSFGAELFLGARSIASVAPAHSHAKAGESGPDSATAASPSGEQASVAALDTDLSAAAAEMPVPAGRKRIAFTGIVETGADGKGTVPVQLDTRQNVVWSARVVAVNPRGTGDVSKQVQHQIFATQAVYLNPLVPSSVMPDAEIQAWCAAGNRTPNPLRLRISGAGVAETLFFELPAFSLLHQPFQVSGRRPGNLLMELLDAADQVVEKTVVAIQPPKEMSEPSTGPSSQVSFQMTGPQRILLNEETQFQIRMPVLRDGGASGGYRVRVFLPDTVTLTNTWPLAEYTTGDMAVGHHAQGSDKISQFTEVVRGDFFSVNVRGSVPGESSGFILVERADGSGETIRLAIPRITVIAETAAEGSLQAAEELSEDGTATAPVTVTEASHDQGMAPAAAAVPALPIAEALKSSVEPVRPSPNALKWASRLNLNALMDGRTWREWLPADATDAERTDFIGKLIEEFLAGVRQSPLGRQLAASGMRGSLFKQLNDSGFFNGRTLEDPYFRFVMSYVLSQKIDGPAGEWEVPHIPPAGFAPGSLLAQKYDRYAENMKNWVVEAAGLFDAGKINNEFYPRFYKRWWYWGKSRLIDSAATGILSKVGGWLLPLLVSIVVPVLKYFEIETVHIAGYEWHIPFVASSAEDRTLSDLFLRIVPPCLGIPLVIWLHRWLKKIFTQKRALALHQFRNLFSSALYRGASALRPKDHREAAKQVGKLVRTLRAKVAREHSNERPADLPKRVLNEAITTLQTASHLEIWQLHVLRAVSALASEAGQDLQVDYRALAGSILRMVARDQPVIWKKIVENWRLSRENLGWFGTNRGRVLDVLIQMADAIAILEDEKFVNARARQDAPGVLRQAVAPVLHADDHAFAQLMAAEAIREQDRDGLEAEFLDYLDRELTERQAGADLRRMVLQIYFLGDALVQLRTSGASVESRKMAFRSRQWLRFLRETVLPNASAWGVDPDEIDPWISAIEVARAHFPAEHLVPHLTREAVSRAVAETETALRKKDDVSGKRHVDLKLEAAMRRPGHETVVQTMLREPQLLLPMVIQMHRGWHAQHAGTDQFLHLAPDYRDSVLTDVVLLDDQVNRDASQLIALLDTSAPEVQGLLGNLGVPGYRPDPSAAHELKLHHIRTVREFLTGHASRSAAREAARTVMKLSHPGTAGDLPTEQARFIEKELDRIAEINEKYQQRMKDAQKLKEAVRQTRSRGLRSPSVRGASDFIGVPTRSASFMLGAPGHADDLTSSEIDLGGLSLEMQAFLTVRGLATPVAVRAPSVRGRARLGADDLMLSPARSFSSSAAAVAESALSLVEADTDRLDQAAQAYELQAERLKREAMQELQTFVYEMVVPANYLATKMARMDREHAARHEQMITERYVSRVGWALAVVLNENFSSAGLPPDLLAKDVVELSKLGDFGHLAHEQQSVLLTLRSLLRHYMAGVSLNSQGLQSTEANYPFNRMADERLVAPYWADLRNLIVELGLDEQPLWKLILVEGDRAAANNDGQGSLNDLIRTIRTEVRETTSLRTLDTTVSSARSEVREDGPDEHKRYLSTLLRDEERTGEMNAGFGKAATREQRRENRIWQKLAGVLQMGYREQLRQSIAWLPLSEMLDRQAFSFLSRLYWETFELNRELSPSHAARIQRDVANAVRRKRLNLQRGNLLKGMPGALNDLLDSLSLGERVLIHWVLDPRDKTRWKEASWEIDASYPDTPQLENFIRSVWDFETNQMDSRVRQFLMAFSQIYHAKHRSYQQRRTGSIPAPEAIERWGRRYHAAMDELEKIIQGYLQHNPSLRQKAADQSARVEQILTKFGAETVQSRLERALSDLRKEIDQKQFPNFLARWPAMSRELLRQLLIILPEGYDTPIGTTYRIQVDWAGSQQYGYMLGEPPQCKTLGEFYDLMMSRPNFRNVVIRHINIGDWADRYGPVITIDLQDLVRKKKYESRPAGYPRMTEHSYRQFYRDFLGRVKLRADEFLEGESVVRGRHPELSDDAFEMGVEIGRLQGEMGMTYASLAVLLGPLMADEGGLLNAPVISQVIRGSFIKYQGLELRRRFLEEVRFAHHYVRDGIVDQAQAGIQGRKEALLERLSASGATPESLGISPKYVEAVQNDQIPVPDWLMAKLNPPGAVRTGRPELRDPTDRRMMQTFWVPSQILSSAYGVPDLKYRTEVYLPPGYDESKKYPTVYFQDGWDYLNYGQGRGKQVLDKLIVEGKMQPVIGIFVVPPQEKDRNRETEYGLNDHYADFFATELVPYVESHYPVKKDRSQRLVIGDSFGGLASLFIAMKYPDVFGHVASQSGFVGFERPDGFSLTRWLEQQPQLAQSLKQLDIMMHVGTLETGVGNGGRNHDFVQANRDLSQLLKSKGVNVQSWQSHADHWWPYWRDEMPNILSRVFPAPLKSLPDWFELPNVQMDLQPAAVAGLSDRLRRLLPVLDSDMDGFVKIDPYDNWAIEAGLPDYRIDLMEWGRDTMVALLGLIETGRFAQAKAIILKWARMEKYGKLPNCLGLGPGWHSSDNSSDAPLWFFEAVNRYILATNDISILDEDVDSGKNVRASLWYIYERYSQQGRGADEFQAGPLVTGMVYVPGVSTWMDTPHTARQGYPIEIQALWYNALGVMAKWVDPQRPQLYESEQYLLQKSVEKYFWNDAEDTVYDVLGANDAYHHPEYAVPDPAVRCNQIFAVYFGLITGERAKKIIQSTFDRLRLPGALRGLAEPTHQYEKVVTDGKTTWRVTKPADRRDAKWPTAEYHDEFHIEKSIWDWQKEYHSGVGWVWVYPFLFMSAVNLGLMKPEEALDQMSVDLLRLVDHPYTHLAPEFPRGSLPEITNGRVQTTQDDAGNATDYRVAPRKAKSQAWSVAMALVAFKQMLRKLRPASLQAGEPLGQVHRSELYSKIKALMDENWPTQREFWVVTLDRADAPWTVGALTSEAVPGTALRMNEWNDVSLRLMLERIPTASVDLYREEIPPVGPGRATCLIKIVPRAEMRSKEVFRTQVGEALITAQKVFSDRYFTSAELGAQGIPYPSVLLSQAEKRKYVESQLAPDQTRTKQYRLTDAGRQYAAAQELLTSSPEKFQSASATQRVYRWEATSAGQPYQDFNRIIDPLPDLIRQIGDGIGETFARFEGGDPESVKVTAELGYRADEAIILRFVFTVPPLLGTGSYEIKCEIVFTPQAMELKREGHSVLIKETMDDRPVTTKIEGNTPLHAVEIKRHRAILTLDESMLKEVKTFFQLGKRELKLLLPVIRLRKSKASAPQNDQPAVVKKVKAVASAAAAPRKIDPRALKTLKDALKLKKLPGRPEAVQLLSRFERIQRRIESDGERRESVTREDQQFYETLLPHLEILRQLRNRLGPKDKARDNEYLNSELEAVEAFVAAQQDVNEIDGGVRQRLMGLMAEARKHFNRNENFRASRVLIAIYSIIKTIRDEDGRSEGLSRLKVGANRRQLNVDGEILALMQLAKYLGDLKLPDELTEKVRAYLKNRKDDARRSKELDELLQRLYGQTLSEILAAFPKRFPSKREREREYRFMALQRFADLRIEKAIRAQNLELYVRRTLQIPDEPGLPADTTETDLEMERQPASLAAFLHHAGMLAKPEGQEFLQSLRNEMRGRSELRYQSAATGQFIQLQYVQRMLAGLPVSEQIKLAMAEALARKEITVQFFETYVDTMALFMREPEAVTPKVMRLAARTLAHTHAAARSQVSRLKGSMAAAVDVSGGVEAKEWLAAAFGGVADLLMSAGKGSAVYAASEHSVPLSADLKSPVTQAELIFRQLPSEQIAGHALKYHHQAHVALLKRGRAAKDAAPDLWSVGTVTTGVSSSLSEQIAQQLKLFGVPAVAGLNAEDTTEEQACHLMNTYEELMQADGLLKQLGAIVGVRKVIEMGDGVLNVRPDSIHTALAHIAALMVASQLTGEAA